MQIKTMRHYLTLVRTAIIKMSTNIKCWWEHGEKGPLVHYWWEYKLVQPLWNMELPQTKSRITIWSSNSTPGYISRKNKIINLKRYMYPSILSSTIYNSQDMEVTQVPVNRWVDKEDVEWVYTHSSTTQP